MSPTPAMPTVLPANVAVKNGCHRRPRLLLQDPRDVLREGKHVGDDVLCHPAAEDPAVGAGQNRLFGQSSCLDDVVDPAANCETSGVRVAFGNSDVGNPQPAMTSASPTSCSACSGVEAAWTANCGNRPATMSRTSSSPLLALIVDEHVHGGSGRYLLLAMCDVHDSIRC